MTHDRPKHHFLFHIITQMIFMCCLGWKPWLEASLFQPNVYFVKPLDHRIVKMLLHLVKWFPFVVKLEMWLMPFKPFSRWESIIKSALLCNIGFWTAFVKYFHILFLEAVNECPINNDLHPILICIFYRKMSGYMNK